MAQASVDVEAVFSAAIAIGQAKPEARAAARALGIDDGDDAGPIDVGRFAQRLASAIAGPDHIVTACRELVAERHEYGYQCDEVSLEAARHAGAPLEVVAAIGMLTTDLEIDPIHFEVTDHEGRAIGMKVEGQSEGMRLEVDLAPDMKVVWTAPIIVVRDALPETIKTAAQGRPLREILGHPALDGLPLTVASVWTDKKGGTAIQVAGAHEVGVLQHLETWTGE